MSNMSNDEEFARRLQQEEIRLAQSSLSSNPASIGTNTGAPPSSSSSSAIPNIPMYEGYATSNVPQAAPVPGGTYYGPGQGFVAQPMGGNMGGNAYSLGDSEQRMLTTYSLGRGIKVLAIIDGVMLLINTMVWGPLLLLVAWGPIAGFYSAKTYNPKLALVYLAYYVLRVTFDVVMLAMGGWWFIISVLVDLFICRYVWTYVTLLRMATPEELNLLRNPQYGAWDRAQPFFRAF